MKKIIATVIIVLAVMFTPQGVYADSEEQNNEYYDRLISEINEGLSFEGDEDVKNLYLKIITSLWKIRPLPQI